MPVNKQIMSIKVADVTLCEAVDFIVSLTEEKKASYVVTPNAEIAYKANIDREFAEIINNADLVLPDGIGVVLASRILKKPISAKVAGVDLAKALLLSLKNTGKRVVFFGGGENVAKEALENIEKEIDGINIIAAINGYFDSDEEMINKLYALDADIYFVCLGSPKQEYFIDKAVKRLGHGVLLGLGGTLDVFSGRVRRAPSFFIKCNLEWLYRIVKQPSRINRAIKLPKYIFSSFIWRIKGKQ